MGKIIELGYTNSLDNKGVILTGECDEVFDDISLAMDEAEALSDGDNVYVWEDDEGYHVGW